MKQMLAAFIIVVLCVGLSGCTARGPVALPWVWYDANGRKAQKAAGAFVDAVVTGDVARVAGTLSPKAQALPETEAAIAALLDGIEGEIIGWDDEGFEESQSRSDGMTTILVQRIFRIYTTENTYEGWYWVYTACDPEPTWVGLDSVYILPAEASYFGCISEVVHKEAEPGIHFVRALPEGQAYDQIEYYSMIDRWTKALQKDDFFTLRAMFIRELREDAAFTQALRTAVDALDGQADGLWQHDGTVTLFEEAEMDGQTYHRLRCHFVFTTSQSAYAVYFHANLRDVPDPDQRGLWAVYIVPAADAPEDPLAVLNATPVSGVHWGLPE